MSPDTEHLAPENSGARCRHLAPGTSPKPGKWGIPKKSFQNAVQKGIRTNSFALLIDPLGRKFTFFELWLHHYREKYPIQLLA